MNCILAQQESLQRIPQANDVDSHLFFSPLLSCFALLPRTGRLTAKWEAGAKWDTQKKYTRVGSSE